MASGGYDGNNTYNSIFIAINYYLDFLLSVPFAVILTIVQQEVGEYETIIALFLDVFLYALLFQFLWNRYQKKRRNKPTI